MGGHPQHQFSRHRRHHRAARRYDAPTARFRPLAGILAFYARLIDEAWVGDTRVRTQDASFYGGWVTPNLDGRINGAPGTGHWQARTAAARRRRRVVNAPGNDAPTPPVRDAA